VLVAGRYGSGIGAHAALAAAGFAVIEEDPRPDQLAEAVHKQRPHICLLDADAPGSLAALAALRAVTAGPRVVVVGEPRDAHDVLAALAAGAAGYLVNDTTADRLADHLEDVAQGHLALSPALVAGIAAIALGAQEELRTGGLTAREHEVMMLLRTRMTSKQIAQRLGVSPTTVRRHASSAAHKLGAQTRDRALRTLEGVASRDDQSGGPK